MFRGREVRRIVRIENKSEIIRQCETFQDELMLLVHKEVLNLDEKIDDTKIQELIILAFKQVFSDAGRTNMTFEFESEDTTLDKNSEDAFVAGVYAQMISKGSKAMKAGFEKDHVVISQKEYRRLRTLILEIEKDKPKVDELMPQVLKLAEECDCMNHIIIQRSNEGKFIILEDLEKLHKYLKETEKEIKKKILRRIVKKQKKLLSRAKAINFHDQPFVQIIQKKERLSEDDLKLFEALLKEKEEERSRSQKKKSEENKLQQEKERIRLALIKADKLGISNHKALIYIRKGIEVAEIDLVDLEAEIIRKERETLARDKASKAIPDLMKKAELLFAKLTAKEQQAFSKKMKQYRESISNNKRPARLKKNLLWIIDKMSKYTK